MASHCARRPFGDYWIHDSLFHQPLWSEEHVGLAHHPHAPPPAVWPQNSVWPEEKLTDLYVQLWQGSPWLGNVQVGWGQPPCPRLPTEATEGSNQRCPGALGGDLDSEKRGKTKAPWTSLVREGTSHVRSVGNESVHRHPPSVAAGLVPRSCRLSHTLRTQVGLRRTWEQSAGGFVN